MKGSFLAQTHSDQCINSEILVNVSIAMLFRHYLLHIYEKLE
jgi:hypothetical protein